MQPTYGELLKSIRQKVNDRTQGDGQIFRDERLEDAARDAISTLYSQMSILRLPLGIVDVVLNIPANQGFLDPRSFGINNIGTVEAILWREATAVAGGPHRASANDVYGVKEPEGGWSGGTPMGVAVLSPGSVDPPEGTHVVIAGVGPHGLVDGDQVVISPKRVELARFNKTNPAMMIAGVWTALAYDTDNFVPQGCIADYPFEDMPVLVTRATGEFTPAYGLDTLPRQFPSDLTTSLGLVSVANETLRWQPMANAMQLRIQYRASGTVPEFKDQRIPVDDCLQVLSQLGAGYALGPGTGEGRAQLEMALGPNLGEGAMGGSMRRLLSAEVRNKQRRSPHVARSYRPRWGPPHRPC